MFSWSPFLAMPILLAALTPAPAVRSQPVTVEHAPIDCAVAGMHPKLKACVRTRRGAALPRVYFRGAGGRSWHYVEMAREGAGCYGAALPKPLADLARFEYYVVAHEARAPLTEGRTSVHSVEVRPPSQGCATPFEPATRVRVFAADGPARPPLGFDGGGVSSLTKDRPNRKSRLLIAGAGAAGTAILTAVDPGGGDDVVLQPAATPTPAGSSVIRSSLSDAGMRLQVVLNGARQWEASGGEAVLPAAFRPGVNELEATAIGTRPGLWTLAFEGASLRLQTLDVVAGERLAQDDRSVTVRLSGRPGERVVVRFEVTR